MTDFQFHLIVGFLMLIYADMQNPSAGKTFMLIVALFSFLLAAFSADIGSSFLLGLFGESS